MNVSSTPIQGLMIAHTQSHIDARGALTRLYCELELSNLVGQRRIVQVNHSCTFAVGAVRGMHFQYPPNAEMKLVRCLKGRVWDVAVDLRKQSPTFLQWHAEELAPDNGRIMVIPEGFAHGFQVIEPASELLYLHTASYRPSAEGALSYKDPKLGILWPLDVTDLSKRDADHPPIDSNFQGLTL